VYIYTLDKGFPVAIDVSRPRRYHLTPFRTLLNEQ
jgi:hypothetical protein